LKQNHMTFSKKWGGNDGNKIGGYCDSYSGSYMDKIDVSRGIVVYGDQKVVKKDNSLIAPTKKEASIDQFLQVNFSNKERALFQITRGASKLMKVLMGEGGNYEWTYSNNTGKKPGTVTFGGGWKGGGYSEITLTSKSKEESVKIKIDGEEHKEKKNYKKPSLTLLRL